MTKKIPIAILGTGNIGTDLLIKVLKSSYLECVAFVGRNLNSSGMLRAASLGVNISDKGIIYLEENKRLYDFVFDATSAKSHLINSKVFSKLKKKVIDLTPAKIGPMCVPSISVSDFVEHGNVNMISCGGQASIPIAYAITNFGKDDVEYIEVVSNIASRSAGPATRQNLDEYISTTEKGLSFFTNAKKVKAILNLNPAEPAIDMQTTILAKLKKTNLSEIKSNIDKIEKIVKTYVPGYKVIVGPLIDDSRVFVTVKVKGLGDYLPSFAGNLDIINCAAIAVAESSAKKYYGK
ncbi:acetaldehyde dehydrogenase (acetylating) [beta proteobacterium KB13]|uniref:Acetaldehyde dehydrogenase n=1 Tax=beta proteobacterium KB13 TaxID=314607 RepID=B6BTH7_9PROT|nr:acetaldehyde dehydrogenase (acetylating) [beta proteobacterium KB13]